MRNDRFPKPLAWVLLVLVSVFVHVQPEPRHTLYSLELIVSVLQVDGDDVLLQVAMVLRPHVQYDTPVGRSGVVQE